VSFKKNTAVTGFTVGLASSTDGSDITTGTPVGYYTLDGGTQTAIGDVTPVHEGNGLWSFDLLAAEMNGDIVGLTFTHASAISAHFTIKTDTKIVSELQDITTAQVNTEADTALSDFWTTPATLVDLVWDEALTGGTHNVTNSAGKRLRQIDAAFEVHSGTAQAGTAGTITLDTGADGTNNDIYRGDRCVIVGGTGIGEHGLIVSYVASTRVATMSETWVVTPDATSEFILVPADVDIETWNHTKVTGDGDWAAMQLDLDAITDTDGVIIGAAAVDLIWDESLVAHQTVLSAGRAMTLGGVAIAETTATGTPTTTEIVLVAGSSVDDYYNDSTLRVLSGTGVGQARIVTDYVGSTKTCTFDEAFITAASSGDAVAISMDHVHSVSQIQSGLATEAKQDIIDTNVDSILVDTAEIGTAGAGLTNIGTIATCTTVTNEVTADVTKIGGDATAATNLSASALGIETGAATATTLTTTTMSTNLSETTDDHYIGRIIVWTSGVLANQATDITDYTGSSKLLTFTATTEAPSDTDTFVIV